MPRTLVLCVLLLGMGCDRQREPAPVLPPPAPMPRLPPPMMPAPPVLAPAPSPAPAPPPRVAPPGATCARDGVGTDPQPLTPIWVAYTTFSREPVQEFGWLGEKTAILTMEQNRDPCVMRRMVTVSDAVYRWYGETLGRSPTPDSHLEGRGTFAAVPRLPEGAAAYGLFGRTGVEMLPEHFESNYASVRDHNAFNHLIFYEAARNHWFYGPKLDYPGSTATGVVHTGFAVFMRFTVAEAVGAQMIPWSEGVSFADARTEVEQMAARYEANTALTFDNTLRIGQAPPSRLGFGATDLFASFLFRLVAVHGRRFIGPLFRAVEARPDAASTEDAVDNLVLAASAAARKNLLRVFADLWRFPVSESARAELRRWGAPIDPARYHATLLP